MKRIALMTALLFVPSFVSAGGMGNMQYLDMAEKAQKNSPAPASEASKAPTEFGSTEDPANIIKSRKVSGSESDSYLRYSFIFIPKSYWDRYLELGDVNGLIELEEYLGTTEREGYSAGEDLEREAERQARARNKALRLRMLYRR